MTEIIAENPQSTSPSLAERLAAMRAEMDAKAALVHDPIFTPAERATMKNWSLQKRLGAAIRNLRMRTRRHTRHVLAVTPRRTHGEARARRSPASTRRATTDSGGSDGDGGGDPEPPRPPHLYSLPARRDGGAL